MLIDYEYMKGIVDIALTNRDIKIDMYIKEAERSDLKPLLGGSFYQKVVDDVSSYTELLEPSTYTDCEGNEVSHEGLKTVLTYFTYARYKRFSNMTDTAQGSYVKKDDWSERASAKELKDLFNERRQQAFFLWESVNDFLSNQTSEKYSLFNPHKTRRKFKFTTI
jgi:hypothetical protein